MEIMQVFQLGYIDTNFDQVSQPNNYYVCEYFSTIEEAGAAYDKLSAKSHLEQFSCFIGQRDEDGGFSSKEEIFLE
jgi:hypothetical protein